MYKIIGDFDKAISDYSEAIWISPDFSMAYRNRSIAHLKKEQFNKAIADLNKAIKIDPKDAFSILTRGSIYMNHFKKIGRACVDWKKACELGQCRNYNYAKGKGLCKPKK